MGWIISEWVWIPKRDGRVDSSGRKRRETILRFPSLNLILDFYHHFPPTQVGHEEENRFHSEAGGIVKSDSQRSTTMGVLSAF
mmetsp:Transcript_125461/g.187366  ORF Transcript_125461/g.187366 Transcript_125461/m.187366 type:complete len:83 (+) Transcript_125461:82-330(+)